MLGSLPAHQGQVDHLLQWHLPKHLSAPMMVAAHAMNVDQLPMALTLMWKLFAPKVCQSKSMKYENC
jgi:hypothetical protein